MPQTNFLNVLKSHRLPVYQEIQKYLKDFINFPSYCQIPKKYQSLVKLHHETPSHYPNRLGKYIRPTLVLLTAKAMGFPVKKAIPTASAMQVSQDWILNHDDIEDNSLKRRGQPCLHRIIGKELAINAGDGLHVLMWKILTDNQKVVGPKTAFQIQSEFYHMLNRTILGQTVEIKWTQENKKDLTNNDILFILESKTGYYTIAGPMRLGAILAKANKNQLDKLYQFGKLLGFSFQIQDDLLDLTSDFKGQKKQTGNDIYEGKRTIMLLHLLRTVNKNDHKKLTAILNLSRSQKTKKEINWVIKKMDQCGSLDYSRKLIKKYTDQAEIYFKKKLSFLSKQPARSQLYSFINFLQLRTY